MRFLLPTVALLFLGFIGFSDADLRYASQPKSKFATRNRANSVAFETKVSPYMEPSTFGYAGLAAQKANNYDNFLRSNVDNEQDNRNFNTEAGKDMLPFRTLETAATDATGQLAAAGAPALNAEPGKEYVLPLRWNNPHASEMELNIWINQNTVVVPIKKPVCAGEGYQDGVISFIVPADFNDAIGSKVVGFQGCTKVGDCVLQMYAHSVEPRVYAAGTPIIISGWTAAKATANANDIQPKTADPGTDLSKQPRDTCLPSTDASANIANAVPRYARQVSDVYNHAYQNSDYSPYSGQQQEAISKTMQAAGVLRMVNGNRGELGKSILTQAQKDTLAKLRNTANNIVQNYEKLTNKIINTVLKNNAKTTDTIGTQKLNACFRCAETASVSANRLQTTTYVPSFKIADAGQLAQARAIVQQANAKYANLINADGTLQIYVQALADMAPAYQQLQQKYGLTYQPAKEKTTTATLADATSFKKVNAAGQKDGGVYAATQAKKAAIAAAAKAKGGVSAKSADEATEIDIFGASSFSGIGDTSLFGASFDLALMSGNEIEVLSIAGGEVASNPDDIEQNDHREDVVEAQFIAGATDANVAADGSVINQGSSSGTCSSSGMSVPMVAAISGAGGAGLVGLIAGAIFYQQKKQQSTVQTNTRVFNDARV